MRLPVHARDFATRAEIVSPSPPQRFVGERAGVRWLFLIPYLHFKRPAQSPAFHLNLFSLFAFHWV